MARGFLAGIIWGTVVAGVGAAGLSLTFPGAGPTAMAPATGMTPQSGSDGQMAPVASAVTDAPQNPATPEAMSPEPMVPSAEDPAPAPAAPEGALVAPQEPDAPGTEPVALAAPDIGAAPQFPLQSSAEATGEQAVQLVTPAPGSAGPETGSETVPETTPETPVAVAPRAGEPAAPTLDAAPEPGTNPPSLPVIIAETPEAPVAVEGAPAPSQQAAVRPAIGVPGVSLINRDSAVPEGRLPTISNTASPAADAAAPAVSAGNAGATLSGDSPLKRFAAAVDVPADVPRMAIVLIDDGTSPMGPEAFEPLPFPVSFALPLSHPDPEGAMAGYRARGFEVLAMADVPQGAAATDVEITLTGLLGRLPESVAVIEDPAGGLQASREISSQATAFLAASGHGLVMGPKGLDTARKTALKEGVPAVTLFRDIDGDGQDPGLIRRTLDQASFRARQEGGVVMMGRVRANTVSALVQWGLQDRGNEITLVPVSTVLTESLLAN